MYVCIYLFIFAMVKGWKESAFTEVWVMEHFMMLTPIVFDIELSKRS